MTGETFVSEVCWRTGIPSRDRAEPAIAATLQLVGERLDADDARALARQLPAALSRFVGRALRHTAFDVHELFAGVQARESGGLGAAVEHAKVVCEVLTEAVDQTTRTRLQTTLPPEWAGLFVARQRPSPERDDLLAGRLGVPPGQGHTLADGRPGSRHPLSEAAPGAPQAESVVRADNPHGADKLSSAPGPRPGTAIAESTGGSEVPLSDAADPIQRKRRPRGKRTD